MYKLTISKRSILLFGFGGGGGAVHARLGPDDHDDDDVADGDDEGWDEEQRHGDRRDVQLKQQRPQRSHFKQSFKKYNIILTLKP